MPYMQGYIAGLAGKSEVCNPYAYGPSNHVNFKERNWQRGHDDARCELMRAALSAQGSNR